LSIAAATAHQNCKVNKSKVSLNFEYCLVINKW